MQYIQRLNLKVQFKITLLISHAGKNFIFQLVYTLNVLMCTDKYSVLS